MCSCNNTGVDHFLNVFSLVHFEIIFVIEFGPINSYLQKEVGYQ